jgi:uncharacterized protein (TIGR03067 family)
VVLGEPSSKETVFSKAYHRLNPSSERPTIDLMVTQGGARGQTMLGIYELVGDRFRVCYGLPGRDRPRDFSPQAGSGHMLQELKRATPSPPPTTKADHRLG